jgi:hypothetical protein
MASGIELCFKAVCTPKLVQYKIDVKISVADGRKDDLPLKKVISLLLAANSLMGKVCLTSL